MKLIEKYIESNQIESFLNRPALLSAHSDWLSAGSMVILVWFPLIATYCSIINSMQYQNHFSAAAKVLHN